MSDSLRRVALGLKLMLGGLLTLLGTLAAGLLGVCVLAVVAEAVRNGGPLDVGSLVLVGFVVGMAVVSGVLGLIGKFLCLAVPEQIGSGRPMLFVSVALDVAGIALNVLGIVSSVAGGLLPDAVETGLGLLNGLAGIGSFTLFLLFARSLAGFVRAPELGRSSLSILYLMLGATGGYLFGVVLVVLGMVLGGGRGNGGGGPFILFACFGVSVLAVTVVLALVGFVRYLFLLGELAKATARFADRIDRDDYDDGNDRHGRGTPEPPRGPAGDNPFDFG